MTRVFYFLVLFVAAFMVWPGPGQAQDDPLVFATVERPPFADHADGEFEGFSVNLMQQIAQGLGRTVQFRLVDSFPEMLNLVETGQVDGAIANISITADRERRIDFSQPIFETGLKILVPADDNGPSVFRALLTRDLLIAVVIALGLLFGSGFLMWLMERRKQPYFDRPMKEALFPSFWWALNLVVNGGFEERMPQSRSGRLFSVLLVVSSLFLVSVFVAQVTAAMTIEALQENVESLNDLDGLEVGTIDPSTSADLLLARDIPFRPFTSPTEMFNAFEAGTLDALVFDAPILAYYASQRAPGTARLLDRNYRPENYGIALPTGSPLREPINRALLQLREDGTYAQLVQDWFGRDYRP